VVQLLYAGHETTRNLIGNGMFTLLQHPAQLARLPREPALLAGAVEEMLRFEPPILFVSRVARADTEWAGVPVRRGDLVQLGLASANRDPEHWNHPDTFEGGRSVARNPSFGWGTHFCLGASIARMEGRVAFETRLGRTARIERTGAPPAWAPAPALRTLDAFPVRLTPA
jgi:cytochrome P450